MTLEEVRAAMQRAQEERDFWEAHYSEYVEKYPDQFVAVHNGEVVATSKDLQGLVLRLKERGLKPTDVRAEFITATPELWIL